MLPVLFVNLDPARIPDEDQFDPEAPTPEAQSAICRASLALSTLYSIRFPLVIAPDLWPRVWQWASFICLYRDHLPYIPRQTETEICLEIVLFAGMLEGHAEAYRLVNSTPGIRLMVAKAWRHGLAITDPGRHDLVLRSLRSFLVSESAAEPEHLAELIDGAGGSLDDLARLVVSYVTALSPGPDDPADMEITSELCLQSILEFVSRVEPAIDAAESAGKPLGPFGTALVAHGFIGALTEILDGMGDVAETPRLGFNMLGAILFRGPGPVGITEALEYGLLHALVVCAQGRMGSKISSALDMFPDSILPQFLVYATVVSALRDGLKEITEEIYTPAFKGSKFYGKWEGFYELAQERVGILTALESGESSSMKACDNIECSAIRVKRKFKRCSGCLCLYYCCEACQHHDWTSGGHRTVCRFYGTLSLGKHNDLHLTARGRSFLRAVVTSSYMASLDDVCAAQVAFLHRHPGEDYVVLFDYTGGAAKVEVEPLYRLSNHEALAGAEWTDIMSRAKRSGGRMRADVVAVRESGVALRYWVVPMRTSSSAFHVGLRQLMRKLGPDRATWDRENLLAELTSLINNEDHNNELTIH
ncbi:hypothetical protein C8R43DRAFT_951438 [Mycena crocata]|nr:hypothetical protein C8R43DRAFT_951438 [Mycena crocata]